MNSRLTTSTLKLPKIPRLLVCIAVVLLIGAGCSDPSGDDSGSAPTVAVTSDREADLAEGLVITVAGSDLTLGDNRIAINVQRTDRTRVDDAAEHLKLTYESIDATAEGGVKEAPLTWRAWPVRSGAYTTVLDFDTPGIWRLRLSHGNEDLLPGIVKVFVREEPMTPAVGEAPPHLASKTASAPDELASITSALNPDPDLYKTSLIEAIRSDQPVVVTFSTPAFCNSATCGPQVDVLSELEYEYGAEAHFIHVELFDNPDEILQSGDLSIARESPLIEAWGLPSEPWTFIMDGDGRVWAKFEAFVTHQELEEALTGALGM